MKDYVIEVQDLRKDFGKVRAVRDISFRIGSGATCALLGANGAGKTTTLALLLGLVVPTKGRIQILGHDMIADRYRVLPRMNFSSPYVDLPQRLTVAENLIVYGRLYGVGDLKQRLRQLAEDLEITHLMQRQYRILSAGQKTRITMAKALLNRPEVMLLDEPTASLDPDSADRIRGYLAAYQRSSGATVLLASHNMTEVERICTDVIMMRGGEIVDQGTPRDLIERFGRATMEEVFLHIARHADMDNETPMRKRA